MSSYHLKAKENWQENQNPTNINWTFNFFASPAEKKNKDTRKRKNYKRYSIVIEPKES